MGIFDIFKSKPSISPVSGRTQMSLLVLPQWKSIVSISGPTPIYSQDARYVNGWVNAKVKYKAENVDVWSPPHTTWLTREGDCEDFAILKYYSTSVEKFLVVGTLKDGRCHCVLICNIKNEWLVMDCMRSEIITWFKYSKEFTPAYFFNKDGVWV